MLIIYSISNHTNTSTTQLQEKKEIKGWRREKKFKLINEVNPSLKFLSEELFGVWPPKEIESRL
jgi:predicted GIY-YIG superfamily endonuclease